MGSLYSLTQFWFIPRHVDVSHIAVFLLVWHCLEIFSLQDCLLVTICAMIPEFTVTAVVTTKVRIAFAHSGIKRVRPYIATTRGGEALWYRTTFSVFQTWTIYTCRRKLPLRRRRCNSWNQEDCYEQKHADLLKSEKKRRKLSDH